MSGRKTAWPFRGPDHPIEDAFRVAVASQGPQPQLHIRIAWRSA